MLDQIDALVRFWF